MIRIRYLLKTVVLFGFVFVFLSCTREKELRSVTVAHFEKFINETNYVTDAEKFGWSIVQTTVFDFKTVPNATWRKPDGIHKARPENPVTQVSYNDAVAYCHWAKVKLPTYQQYWDLALKDQRRINVFYDSILPSKGTNFIGNVWEITKPEHNDQIRLAGGSYLCNKNTCDGTNRERELIVDSMTGNIHVSFAVLVDL
ncbi:SUMF1/EgtB/PvdO family nonheme iron enzyme [Aquimarina sp. U1-2]|uniref:SUMF1/EgtB/PvdO family nonheme iron enzyme n=1 Tax=Aquimarina sp. U1-2 TaxID=2823141 RepID=UPI001AECDB3B|nr:SUMF1/EgtB/PvdO family nonheme iron enzyme [Aquimarina sp. U1-2]MBP2832916.1 SUMF1/EgtB/PvdO family nonheme iron enzyme [Aquimarina sp. U1-2]